MISFYTGTPGSGKSYHLAQLCYDTLRYKEINIIANFEINLNNVALTRLGRFKRWLNQRFGIRFRRYNKRRLKGHFYYWDNSQVTVRNLLLFAQQNHVRRRKSVDAPQTLVLLDESGIVFNCRAFSTAGRQEWVNFFAKHRHYNFDFVLACQFDRQVDRQIRCCVEYEQQHRKLRNFQFLGWLLSVLAGGNLFVVNEMWYAGKLKVRNSLLRYNPRIASLYDTLRDFSAELGAELDELPPGVGGERGPAAGRTAARPPSAPNVPAEEAQPVREAEEAPDVPEAGDSEPQTAEDLEALFARYQQILGGG